jgi:hypothetical protein
MGNELEACCVLVEEICQGCKDAKIDVKEYDLGKRTVRLCLSCAEHLSMVARGDVVNIINFYREVLRQERVERTTRAQVVMTNGSRYNKSDGKRRGGQRSSEFAVLREPDCSIK